MHYSRVNIEKGKIFHRESKKQKRRRQRKALGLQKKADNSKSFYKSEEWLRLRYKALKRSNGCCDCCGARGKKGAALHVDHILPRFKFPEKALDLTNLQVLCPPCNYGKGTHDQTDWREYEIWEDA